MKKLFENRSVKTKTVGACLALLVFFSICATNASAQTLSPQALKLMAERAKLDAKRGTAYEMGVQIGFGMYQAEVTQTEEANQNSKIYGPALNLRTAAFGAARAAADSINSVISLGSDKLDIQQFYQYADLTHEKDALKVAQAIQLNLETKLGNTNGNLHDAFMLGYAAGYTEANATGGEPRRKHVGAYLELSNYYGKKMKIYNAAGGTLTQLAKDGTAINSLYPKIVGLRQWYSSAVGAIK